MVGLEEEVVEEELLVERSRPPPPLPLPLLLCLMPLSSMPCPFPPVTSFQSCWSSAGLRPATEQTSEETMRRLKTELQRRNKSSRPPASTASTVLFKIPTDNYVSFITAAILGISNKQVFTGLTGRKWSMCPSFLSFLSGYH